MVIKYLIERRSWILLFIVMQILTLSLAYLDSDIPIGSLWYIVFLSSILFVIFLVLRYHRETRFYKSLTEWDPHLDVTTIAEARSPFEVIITENLLHQTEKLKQETAQHRISLEEEQDDLLSWVHEVKTPLTAMNLMIERLNDETLKNQLTYEWLRIHHLLDQQLHQKRMLFMENDLYVEQVDLKGIISQEIRTLRSWCMQKGIGFDVELEVKEVLTDAKWLGFIIRQLLTNAVKYSENLDICLRSYILEERTILEVQDWGRGIDPKDLPRIFDKGFTSTLNHQDHSSTGMGLYLAKKAAESLMILIHVHTVLGEGTTVRLTLPQRNDFLKIQESNE